ncbi:MauE/DoxX family redox-associated membrane protein [Pedobacter sp. AW31-3R]|uniref:MauE/DoxX family redox-associated membrane protein n=1 Tax=Pedobacter sp. AW31-3R TaxID=3445781 RepID=UPI003FA13758
METVLKKIPVTKLSGKTRRNLLVFVTNVFILLFVYTAVSKIITFHTFSLILSKSVLIGSFSTWVAYFIPSTEILLSILLIIPRTNRIALIGSFVLMLLFTCYLVYMIYFETTHTCNCGGVLTILTWKQHLLLNLVLTGLSATGIFLSPKKP